MIKVLGIIYLYETYAPIRFYAQKVGTEWEEIGKRAVWSFLLQAVDPLYYGKDVYGVFPMEPVDHHH